MSDCLGCVNEGVPGGCPSCGRDWNDWPYMRVVCPDADCKAGTGSECPYGQSPEECDGLVPVEWEVAARIKAGEALAESVLAHPNHACALCQSKARALLDLANGVA